MTLKDKWQEIKAVFEAAWSSMHVSVATVDTEGNPHVAPIGSLILRDDFTGYYFEEFPEQLPKNLDGSGRVAILAVNSDAKYWLESLSNGKFKSFPGMRLKGTSLGTREANSAEIAAWHARVKFAEGLKGHNILWKDMKTVRELTFDDFKPVLCGQMTADLLK